MIWEGFYYARTGYGEATRQYAVALEDLGIPLTARLAPSPDHRHGLSPALIKRVESMMRRQPQGAEVRVQQVLAPDFARDPDAVANIGYTVLESDRIPRHWVSACQEMDEVWVPSRFCLESFVRSGVSESKLHVIPHGVDCDRFRPEAERLELEGARGFIFLSVFDWVWRKGWDVLLRAYYSEFGADEDVCLVVRASRLNSAEISRFVADEFNAGPRPNLLILPFAVGEEMMPSLYATADAFVVPSRGEGWGLAYSEAMAAGLPTIATRYGGHLDFMNDGNSFLVEVDRMVPMDEEVRLLLKAEVDLQWAEPSIDHLREIMRWVFEHREEAKARGRVARAAMCRATWRRAALRVWERIEELGEHCETSVAAMLALAAAQESGTGDENGVDKLGELVAARLAELERVDELSETIVAQLRKRTPAALRRRLHR